MVKINDKLLKRAIGHLGRTRLRLSSATPLEKPAGVNRGPTNAL
jgi:hypothetical protein